jgi:nucleoside 2-deoxyribosyltransferase
VVPSSLVWVIGDVIVDVLFAPAQQPHVRLGGVLHAARALSALGAKFSLAATLPSYLRPDVERAAREYGATSCHIFGDVVGAPNIILVLDPTEAGPQGYELLLRDSAVCCLNLPLLKERLSSEVPTDILIFPGSHDLGETLAALRPSSARVHVDAAYGLHDPSILARLGRPLSTFIISTSSQLFLGRYGGNPHSLVADLLGNAAEGILLKENRGGARLFTAGRVVPCPAQASATRHSVGVGDCFDAVFIGMRTDIGDLAALQYAACLAAEYASTLDLERFRQAARGHLAIPLEEISTIQGVQLPWEERPKAQIYLAAPDFSYVDTTAVEATVAALEYHNFRVRRPVRENGELGPAAPKEERIRVATADAALLRECTLIVAVLPYDDPGTLVEIGLGVSARQPVIVYDPGDRVRNPMVAELASAVCTKLSDVVAAVFRAVSQHAA